MKFQPLNDRLLVQRLEEEERSTGDIQRSFIGIFRDMHLSKEQSTLQHNNDFHFNLHLCINAAELPVFKIKHTGTLFKNA